MSWVDPELTETGLQQAQDLGKFWTNAIKTDKVAAPTSFYSSPLRRCLQTVETTWQNIPGLPPSKPPVVHESLREIFGVHTCDKRRSTSQIQAEFPYFDLSLIQTADDTLWTTDRRETMQEHAELWQQYLQDLFDNDESTYVSITTHSGATRALYLAIGHPDVWTAAGSVVPIVVRGRRVKPD
ncbi:hypothetical protein B0A48_07002 [Cryoendolithus antarcticus]|uniref:Phosphoglycerate mutase-like protein n=1 Tax=Cryoendolithus antarcticus TaxID=1507870 RepID=A0A1V8T7C3_9PEZI|nr:hypothetical protein B0A48_07002 [Cryoendolithus antarcticus]